jgi:surface antigen
MMRSVTLKKHYLIPICCLVVLVAGWQTGCSGLNKAQSGAVVGGLGGAAVGGQLGPEEDRAKNALIGAGIGLALGYIIGNEWQKYDEQRLNRTLEYNRTNETTSWVNPDTGKKYRATPVKTYTDDGRIYRDVVIRQEDGSVHETKAYRNDKGQWVLVK